MDLLPKGESAQMVGNKIGATLSWKEPVDLDLHIMYTLKDGRTVKKEAGGLLAKILGNTKERAVKTEGHINYRNMGSKTRSPFIKLDQDSGVGDVGGDNEENVHFENLDNVEHAIIVANIFNKISNFSKFDGHVAVRCGNDVIECPLVETDRGSWCTVAMLDNTGITPRLLNINKTTLTQPSVADFV